MFKKNLIFTFLKIFLISKKWMWLSFFNELFNFPFLSILCWLIPLFSVNIFSLSEPGNCKHVFSSSMIYFLICSYYFLPSLFLLLLLFITSTLFLLKVCLHCVCSFFLSISLLKQRSEVKVLRTLVPASWAEISPGEWGGCSSSWPRKGQ